MWCLISQPNSVILEVQVDPKAIGQECLEKVCEWLGINVECDYFGLKNINHKGEELGWLNLRNPLAGNDGTPLRFALRVKFWVPPHLLLQEATKHQFYLSAKKNILESRLKPIDWAGAARLIALIAQAESGDYDQLKPPHGVYSQCCHIAPDDVASKPADLLQMVVNEHRSMKEMKQSTAEYWLLKEVSTFDTFGEEMFMGKPHGSVTLGVGPHGISVYQQGCEKQSIPFTAIQSAQSQKKIFRLEYLNLDGEENCLEIKLDSSQIASGLYRAITEKHAFYSCETVRSAVTAQCIRDFKGTIISIFNEDSSLGKKYVFDIRRTCREVYDNARRALYRGPNSSDGGETSCSGMEGASSSSAPCNCCDGQKYKETQERLARILDALTCRICMDNTIDTAFLPCSHAMACSTCAARCERCPLCRADIQQAQRIFLPLDKHTEVFRQYSIVDNKCYNSAVDASTSVEQTM